jgi:hypothetical protein
MEDSVSPLTINDKLNNMIESVLSFVEESEKNNSTDETQGENEVRSQGRSPR